MPNCPPSRSHAGLPCGVTNSPLFNSGFSRPFPPSSLVSAVPGPVFSSQIQTDVTQYSDSAPALAPLCTVSRPPSLKHLRPALAAPLKVSLPPSRLPASEPASRPAGLPQPGLPQPGLPQPGPRARPGGSLQRWRALSQGEGEGRGGGGGGEGVLAEGSNSNRGGCDEAVPALQGMLRCPRCTDGTDVAAAIYYGG